MPFGLATETISTITQTIAINPAIQRIGLFGSRALGRHKSGSDIDIVIWDSGLKMKDLLEISLRIDKLELPYKVDIIQFGKVTNPELVDHICRVGVVLFEDGIFRQYGLPPVIHPGSRYLILGSFPSRESLRLNQYYASPSNAFWRVISAVVNERCPEDYNQRLLLLKHHRFALWDVLESCLRQGSGDTAIRHEIPNKLEPFIKSQPALTHLLFNGMNPVKFFAKHSLNEGPLVFVPSFPSTSSRYSRLSEVEKIDRWSVIQYLPRR